MGRTYTAEEVATLRSEIKTVTPSHYLAKKLYWTLRNNFNKRETSNTFGAMDGVQAMTMSRYLTSVYVSGWQCSVTVDDPGPDLADYPWTTLPTLVQKIVNSQMLHERRQNEARSRMTPEERKATPRYDYLTPCIADADAGFGGTGNVMKLIKLFVENGAAGIHMED